MHKTFKQATTAEDATAEADKTGIVDPFKVAIPDSDDDELKEDEEEGRLQEAEEQGREKELGQIALLQLNPFLLDNFSKRKTRYMAAFDVEKWAAGLGDLTFPTVSAPLSWEEASAVVHYFQEGVCNRKGAITKQDSATMYSLRGRIHGLLQKLAPQCPENAFFVRLGPRSPKDAPVFVSRSTPLGRPSHWSVTAEKVREAMCSVVSEDPRNVNEVHRNFQEVAYSLLRVASADDALMLLLSSSRVMQDLCHTMDHGKECWDVSIVARAWDTQVRLEREFRAFMVEGTLTAISQYDDQFHYSFAAQHFEAITISILSCFERAKHCLTHLGYTKAAVVDFVVVPPAETSERANSSCWEARIVELNPFGLMTGSALFAWNCDRRLLQGGKDIYGDLEEWDRRHPEASKPPLARHIHERHLHGIVFRYCAEQPPGLNWERLRAEWEDYLSIAPAGLAAPPTK